MTDDDRRREEDTPKCPKCGGRRSDECRLCRGAKRIARADFEVWHDTRAEVGT